MLEHEIEPEIDKYDTHKNSVFQNGTPYEKMPKGYFPWTGLSDF